MGSYARFEHYLTTLEVETCPTVFAAFTGFWPTVHRWSGSAQAAPALRYPLYAERRSYGH